MTPEDKQSVAAHLEALVGRMGALEDLTIGKPSLSPTERAEAQAGMKALKAELEGEGGRIKAATRAGTLTPAEGAFYQPAIERAGAILKVRWNQDPLVGPWSTQLNEALAEVKYWLNNLGRAEAE